MEIKAKLNYIHIAPRKVRLVASLIRGMDVGRAEGELRHLSKRSALPLLKLLKSALANAINNFGLENKQGLYIKNLLVNQGPTLKRQRPRAFGRAALIRKRMSRVILTLGVREETTSGPKTKKKKEAPLIRDVTAEDIKIIEPHAREEKEISGEKIPKTRPADFVRRVFRRKAI